MTINDVADLLFAARARIDFHWNFYVVVVIAVVGWLVSLKRALPVSTRLLVSAVYLIASVSNLMGLQASYTIAEALRTDLLRIAAASPLTDTWNVLQRHSYLAHRTAALWTHVAVGTAVLLAIWFSRPAARETAPARPAASPAAGA